MQQAQQVIKVLGCRSLLGAQPAFKLLLLLIFLCLSLHYFVIYGGTDILRNSIHVTRSSVSSAHVRSKPNVTIATVACSSRFEEALTLIKSALIFGKNVELNFIVFVDESSRRVMRGMLENLQNEAPQYDFRYIIQESEFPPGQVSFWKNMFASCSTQRLFFPTILPTVDSLLYMDSDTLFLSDVGDLWSFTEKMSHGVYIGAMAPEHEITGDGWYNLHSQVPYYGKRGLNAGVMLMNLTRMREMDFVSSVRKIVRQYFSRIAWADQDILNIFFHFYPEKLLEIGCEYNFRAQHCDCQYRGDCSCRKAEEEGARVIHGNRKMFHSRNYLSFSVIYNVFRDFKMKSETVEDLLKKLEDSFDNLPSETPCSQINENHNLFHRIRKYIS